jgi:hypothetical protein
LNPSLHRDIDERKTKERGEEKERDGERGRDVTS